MSEKEPSEEFKAAVRVGTSIKAKCELCDRTCFEDDANLDWEAGEYKLLQYSAEHDPNHYHPMDKVEVGCIDDKDVVVNCPCNGLRKFEDWIWTHRHVIANYVAIVTKKKAEEAFSEEAEAEALKEGINTPDKALKFIKCKGCNGYFADELMIAQAGELFCEQCARKVKMCPKCNQWFNSDTFVNGICEPCYTKEEEERRIRTPEPYDDSDLNDSLPF